jgi:integrase
MARPRDDGTPAAAPDKRKLNQHLVTRLQGGDRTSLIWDTQQHGLVLQVRPGGHKAWKCIYARRGRPRWYSLGNAAAIALSDARKLAARIMFQVAEGKDPAAEKTAQRSKGTFEELAQRYVEQHAKRKNKSWRQPDALVRKHLLPRWAKLQAGAITRADVKAVFASIAAPHVANQTIGAASAIFAWAVTEEIVKANPCVRIEMYPKKSRERVLADSEVAEFWAAFDNAGLVGGALLKMILLTGQRPGEVAHMRREHIVDGWWQMPGDPVPELDWPGTKNGHSHRVWLPKAARVLLADMPESGPLFIGPRGKIINPAQAMRRGLAASGVRTTPHDLRRTHGTTITALSFGRDAMNRIQNHVEGGIASVYDRHQYADENRKIMETVASRIMALVEGGADSNVLQFGRAK